MKFGIISDLHLDHHYRVNKTWPDLIVQSIIKQCQDEKVDYLINAGDTSQGNSAIQAEYIHRYFEENVENYIFVEGNHDLYGKEWSILPSKLIELPNGSLLYACTLWTDFHGNYMSMVQAQSHIPDFTEIKNVWPEHMYEEYKRYTDEIYKYSPDILVTHFATTPKSISPRFVGNVLNDYFVPNMYQTISENNVNLSIFGHTHMPIDYDDGECRYVNNALGYWKENMRHPYDYKVKIIND